MFPDNYLQPRDDGLPTRPVGEWTAEKLWYLERYLSQTLTALRDKPWRGLHYIDLFAGPGKGRTSAGDVLLGSPLLAVTLKYRFTGYFFSDIDGAYIDALRQRCSGVPDVRYFVGDANEVVRTVTEIINGIDREYLLGQWSSMNVAFLDPEGLELKWDTVETLSRVRRMDMLIYYPQMGINREASKEYQKSPPTSLDYFFGGSEWRDVYAHYPRRELHSRLVELYKRKLRQLGYKVDFDISEPLMRNKRRRAPLYRLLLVSKHPLGAKFWRNALAKDRYGQKRLL